jgi:phosphomannomutase
VGADCALSALSRAGFDNVHTVAAQKEPDGRFPTVRFPNPEEPGSMDAVLKLAQETGAALACANDPDADRLAVAARDDQGALTLLTGDELGLLLADEVLRHGPQNAAVGTTLVSARGLSRLAAHYGAHYFETLTGFKWLALKARTQAQAGRRFAFAYEEALGYAIGDVVWDKDGISALLAIAKLAATLMENKQTLWHRLAQISQKVGVAVSSQATIALDAAGAQALMATLRQAPPQAVGPFDVVSVSDLMNDETCQAMDLPQANVVLLQLQQRAPTVPRIGHARIIVRPSGTEPKVKCYYDMLAECGPQGDWASTRAYALEQLHALMRAHQKLVQKV